MITHLVKDIEALKDIIEDMKEVVLDIQDEIENKNALINELQTQIANMAPKYHEGETLPLLEEVIWAHNNYINVKARLRTINDYKITEEPVYKAFGRYLASIEDFTDLGVHTWSQIAAKGLKAKVLKGKVLPSTGKFKYHTFPKEADVLVGMYTRADFPELKD